MRLIDAGYIVEAQELELYKSAKTLQMLATTSSAEIKEETEIAVKQEAMEGRPVEEADDEANHGFMMQQRMNQLYNLLGFDHHQHDRREQDGSPPAVEATKTSCALRTAIVHSALQRSTTKKCIHCRNSLRYVKFMHQKLVYYMTLAEIKEK